MTNEDRTKLIEDAFTESARLHEQVLRERTGTVMAAADLIGEALRRGNKILVFGNGGSAADSQHFAAELVGRFGRERKALPAIALTTDTSALTSIGNDYGFDRVFARQVEALGRPGDVTLGISTSGLSRNVLAAFETARSAGLTTIALTGRDGGAAGTSADLHVNVPSAATPRIQEVHRTILHVICELVEAGFS